MSCVAYKNCKISAIKTVIPKDYIDIDNEIEFFGNSEKRLKRAKEIVGYGRRYVTEENTTVSDMGYEAANELLNELKVNRDEIDTILFLSQCRDYIFPTTANVLHGLLDLPETCAAMDISQGCSGFVHALWLAYSLIQSGASKKLLLISGDTLSKYSDKANRLIAPLFGDSVSALLIEYSPEETLSYFSVGAKGKSWDKIVCPAGGERIPIDEEVLSKTVKDEDGNPYKLNHLIMSGIDVFDFTAEYAPKSIRETLDYAKMSIDDISLFLLHQANKQIVETIATEAGLPLSKTPVNTFGEYANTACNSLGIHISNNLHDINGNILLCGFGVGLSFASAIIKADGIKNLGISVYKDTKNTKTAKELKEYWYKRFMTKEE